MIKIKLSYERPEELQHVLHLLRPEVKTWKRSGNREGRFLKAYIELNEPGGGGQRDLSSKLSKSRGWLSA